MATRAEAQFWKIGQRKVVVISKPEYLIVNTAARV